MAKLGDQLEKYIDESMPYLFEKLSDTSALKNFGCLTVAQCALLVPSILTSKQSDDASEMGAHYIQLALLDIAHGKLSPKHPETHLPYAQYQRMAETGMFGNDGENMPLPTANWLVSLDEAKRWLQSIDIQINFDELKTELAKMAALEAAPDAVPAAKVAGVKRSITKQQAVNAFEDIHFSRDRWNRNLGDIKSAPWLGECRVSKGIKGDKTNPSTWNPVLIASDLFSKKIKINRLDAVFQIKLKDWLDEWIEVSTTFRE